MKNRYGLLALVFLLVATTGNIVWVTVRFLDSGNEAQKVMIQAASAGACAVASVVIIITICAMLGIRIKRSE